MNNSVYCSPYISFGGAPITNGRLEVCGGLAKRHKSTNLVVSGPRNLFQDPDLIPEPSSEAGSNFRLIPHVVLPFLGVISGLTLLGRKKGCKCKETIC